MANVSIIARITEPEHVKRNLRRENAKSERGDRQTETWFATTRGRLVLREYDTRNELAAVSDDGAEHPVRHKPDNTRALKEVLLQAIGLLAIVEKRRETFTMGDTLVHIDEVEGLGPFVEIEAVDADGATDEAHLRKRCHAALKLIGIPESDLIEGRYVDLILG